MKSIISREEACRDKHDSHSVDICFQSRLKIWYSSGSSSPWCPQPLETKRRTVYLNARAAESYNRPYRNEKPQNLIHSLNTTIEIHRRMVSIPGFRIIVFRDVTPCNLEAASVETVCFFETTLNTYQTIPLHILEDNNIHSYQHEELKFNTLVLWMWKNTE
jgi:hypothetical protein